MFFIKSTENHCEIQRKLPNKEPTMRIYMIYNKYNRQTKLLFSIIK